MAEPRPLLRVSPGRHALSSLLPWAYLLSSLSIRWPFPLLHVYGGKEALESHKASEERGSCCRRLKPNLGQGVYSDPVTSCWDEQEGSLPTQETP